MKKLVSLAAVMMLGGLATACGGGGSCDGLCDRVGACNDSTSSEIDECKSACDVQAELVDKMDCQMVYDNMVDCIDGLDDEQVCDWEAVTKECTAETYTYEGCMREWCANHSLDPDCEDLDV